MNIDQTVRLDNAQQDRFFQRTRKAVAKTLIVLMAFLDIPVLPLMSQANAAVAAIPPASAIQCAVEWGATPCVIPAGQTATVWYGAGSAWTNKTKIVGSVDCNNATFSDPIPGTVKSCKYLPDTSTPPLSAFDFKASIIKVGETATYTVVLSQGFTYSWSFGDGSTPTAYSANPSISHSYSQPGLYFVTLSAKDIQGTVTSVVRTQAVATNRTALSPTMTSPIVFEKRVNATSRIWVVNPDNDSVSVIDDSTKTLVATINVGVSPRTLTIAPDGRVWVANKLSSTISIVSPTSLSVEQTINLPRGSQPHGVVFSPNGGNAYVALEATGQIVKFNSTGVQLGLINIGTNVRHIAVDADSQKLLVTRFITPALPGESTVNVDTTVKGGEVIVVNTAGAMSVNKIITLAHSDKVDAEAQGSGIPNYLVSPAISPDGITAWVPSKQDNIKRGMARNGQPLNFQNTVRAISSRIDMTTLTENLASRIDHDNSSLGSAAVYHPSGDYLFVALETSREVAVINPFNNTQLFRLNVGIAPQGLVLSEDGNTLYVHEFMDRSVSVFDLKTLTQQGLLSSTSTNVIVTVPAASEKLPANVLAGKKLFYDAKDPRLALDSYMSCASCHNDGGHDGRVWDLTGFGEGLRNTIALKGRAAMGHGNLHWSANFDELQDFEGQIRALAGGKGLMTDAQFNTGTRNQALGDKKAGVSADLDSLAAYVTSLNTFAQSPNRNADGTLTAAATAGKTVFANSCASCHGGANFTLSSDGTNLKNIGTINALSGQRLSGPLNGIDIPTLRDAWATAPYLHNGSATTITAAVQAHNNLALNATDLANVVAYVQQIGSEESGLLINSVDTDGDGIVDALDLYPNDAARGAGIWREQYNAIGAGDTVADLTTAAKYPNAPDVVAKMTTFTSPDNIGDNYGSRIRGIFTAPETGAYTFWVAGDNEVRLYLSTDNTAAKKTQIAYVPGWSFSNEWAKYPEQKSVTINLVAGQNYYLEVLHKEGWGGDGVAVAWQTPSNPTLTVMTDQFFQKAGGTVTPPPSNVAPTVAITAPAIGTAITQGATVAITATAADSDGTVAKVEFYDGATLLGADTTAPYAFSWVTSAATVVGAHAITAKATDNTGAVTTSAAVSLTVSAPAVVSDADGDGVVDALDLYPNDATRGAGIWREQYNAIGGGILVTDLTSAAKYPNAPDVVAKMTTFTSPDNIGDNYGSRIRGIFTAPATGAYTFWIAGDDEVRLYLSTDNTAANKTQIAFVPGWSFSNEWTKYPQQKSVTINLEAGKNYYLEALHKEAGGGDGVAVAWQTPSNPTLTVMTDQFFQKSGGNVTPPSNIPPTSAIQCALEWDATPCIIPSGQTGTVWYGVGSTWVNKTNIVGTIDCNNATFGDPIPGTVKSCKYVTTTNQPQPPSVGNWIGFPTEVDPMMSLTNIPANASSVGMWSQVYNWPINSIHLMMLPDGRVLSYGADPNGGGDGRYYDFWNPNSGFGAGTHKTIFSPEAINSFCSTNAFLNDGRLMVTSGFNPKESIFIDWAGQKDSLTKPAALLANDRWYSTLVTLPDSRKVILGGMVPANEPMWLNPDQAIAQGLPSMTPEIYEDGKWRTLFGANSRLAFGPDFLRVSYPKAFLAPNGNVFGVSGEKMWYMDVNANNGNGAITSVYNYKTGYGNMPDPVNVGSLATAVMYDIGKIIITGGNGGYFDDGFTASNMATSIDINNGTPVLTELPRMTNPRRMANGNVLATGEVVITGGSKKHNNNGADAVYSAEIWNPKNNTWVQGSNAAIFRGYHGTAILLRNGAILSSGGGNPGPVTNQNAEIYYPPNLFAKSGAGSALAVRPVIAGVNGLKHLHNANFEFDMANTNTISSVVLLGMPAATHANNPAQRRIPLQFTQVGKRITSKIPNANLTPPGYYQLVAVNAQGVPSYSVTLSIGDQVAMPQIKTIQYDPNTGL